MYSVKGKINIYRKEWLTQLDRMVNETSKLIRLHKQEDVDTQKTQSEHACQYKRSLSQKGKMKKRFSFPY
jgi:hypothetical protein